MIDLMIALKNYGTYAILSDCFLNGFAKRTKDSDRSKYIPCLLKHELVEIVPADDSMMRFVRFENEQSKQNYIEQRYFLKITEKGKFAYHFFTMYWNSLTNERKRAEEALAVERKRIATALLKNIGLDLADMIDSNDDQ